jgi:hypothetical protein
MDATAGNAIAESSQPADSRYRNLMAIRLSDAGLVRRGAKVAHGLLRDQVLALLAPVSYLRYRRRTVESGGEITDVAICGLTRVIDRQTTDIGRS